MPDNWSWDDVSGMTYAERDAARQHVLARMDRPAPNATLHVRRYLDIPDGILVAAGDAHYWPGDPSTAHRALLRLVSQLQPAALVLMGDMIDGARISRWPLGAWQDALARPSPQEEIAVSQKRLRELERAAGDASLHWVMGNHDARFESYLTENAPEFAGIEGTRLKDHFPSWLPSWSVRVNDEADTPTVIKHRWKGGVHAAYNNAVQGGVNMVTGHLHSLQVRPYTDYRGTRYGVDAGTLAVSYDRPFIHYTEDAPVNWRSGFAVLTFVGGRLLPPETVQVLDEAQGLVAWRGKVIEV